MQMRLLTIRLLRIDIIGRMQSVIKSVTRTGS